MNRNALPAYDMSDNPTGCCPRFRPEGWDGQDLHFEEKPFVRAETKSVLHVPINMGAVFARTQKAIEDAKAMDEKQFIVLSREQSPWSAEHLFAVKGEVPGEEMVRLSGDFRTKVFEGPFKDMPRWREAMDANMKALGRKADETYFFYTTCPKCAKAYGKNYVVAVAKYTPETS
jgi:hypothetical protein